MKLSSKPMSSPGRTEKYPPPLMRFLRSNVGSRSRGRSRSSPMFVRKKNTAIETTQEPSSPKVTCIGQVRVRRSKQTGKSKKPGRNRVPARRRCRWVASALFCRNFHVKLKHMSFRPCFRKWVLFFQSGFRRKAEVREKSRKFESNFQEKEEEIDRRHYQRSEVEKEEDEEEEEEEYKNLMYSSSTPPKNALLLTRCRSAPYRSSSLASRFWGSPLVTDETEEEEAQKKACENRNREEHQQQQQSQHIENETPTSESEPPSCRDSAAESRTDPEEEEEESEEGVVGLRCSKEEEGGVEVSVNHNHDERSAKSMEIDEEEEEEEEKEKVLKKTGGVCSVVNVGPVILTRCKSEPASRTAEAIFCRKENVWFR